MVPASLVRLDAMPLTPNGKLDRARLPQPGDSGLDREAYHAPRNPMEARLCEIWQAVLGVQRVGIHDNFFVLGGDSLTIPRLVNRIHEELPGERVRIPIKAVFDGPSVAAMAEFIEAVEISATLGSRRREMETMDDMESGEFRF
jgi:acyl carrier protein